MSRAKEVAPKENLSGEPFVLPGVGVGRVIRNDVPIIEHANPIKKIPCSGQYGAEIEFPKQVGRKLICQSCRNF